MTRSLFIFRRDLRLIDNTGLMAASRAADEVMPLFVMDDRILFKFAGHSHRLAFMFGTLSQLQADIEAAGGTLNVACGDPALVVEKLILAGEVQHVFVNCEYTPFGQSRDRAILRVCERHGASFHSVPDVLLNEPSEVRKKDGTPYVVFTPYHRAARERYVPAPDTAMPRNLSNKSVFNEPVPTAVVEPRVLAGRDGAEAALARIDSLADYSKTRDSPALDATSRLSCHLRFGTISPREAYQCIARSLGRDHPLIRQLYWRDFFTHIAFHFPHVFNHAFRRQYDALKWVDDEALFNTWCEGKTGFPIVDAGMRELVATGFMHNRVRMITASFLVKNMHVDWRKGEAFFARYLIDFDPCVNNGNWQWAASTGCDAQPYFRIFNPWRQQARFDPEALYIKKWIPELSGWPAKKIHDLEKTGADYYPKVVDLKMSAAEIKDRFKALAQSH